MLLSCALLAACAPAYTNPKIEGKQNLDYVVVSNGDSAVQFGNYVYFINGYRGYEDQGDDNKWGNVVKGGLYRAELSGGKDEPYYYMTSFGVEVRDLTTYRSAYNTETGYNFVTDTQKDVVIGLRKDDNGNILYDDDENPYKITEDVTNAKVDRLASKVIGTSGYKKGGLFIYGDYIYYATPSNSQNRDGSFAVDKTEFYRTKLDGTSTMRIYKTKNASSSSPYAFYYQNDKIYLCLQDGTSIISVTVGNKVEEVKELATDVTGSLFPYKDVYYSGIDTNSVEDFIYFTRDYTDDDSVKSGNVLTVMRPDGSEKFELKNGNTVTLNGVNNGYLFYQDKGASETVIRYTNLHDQLTWVNEETGKPNSPTYTEAYNAALKDIREANGENSVLIGDQSGIAFSRDNISSYTGITCIRPSKRSNQVFAYCISSSGLFIGSGSDYFETLYSGSVGTIYAIVDTDVYFNSSSTYYIADRTATGVDLITIAENMNADATFGLDIIGNLVMVFGEVDEYASDYALFFDLDRLDNGKQFVGVRNEGDSYDYEAELNPPSVEEDKTEENKEE